MLSTNFRNTTAFIDLSALQSNLAIVREYAPNSRVMAVIKSDAYGHGILKVAESLYDSINAFAVACIVSALHHH